MTQKLDQVKRLKEELQTASAPNDGAWVFDKKVADVFEDMLALSIPGYNDMRDVTHRLGTQHLRSLDGRGRVLDIGASTGESSSTFIERFPASQFLLCDISEAMLARMQERFLINKNVTVAEVDLRARPEKLQTLFCNDGQTYDLVLSVLTLIFVPMAHKKNVLRGVYKSMSPGGMFIITEKLHGNSYLTDNLLVDSYHELKHDNGYSYEAIERKRISLETVQVCKTQGELENDLSVSGFRHVECVHRYLNFATFIAIK